MRTWNQNGESVGCDPEQSGTAACASGLMCAVAECRACCREAALESAQRGDQRGLLPPEVQAGAAVESRLPHQRAARQ